MSTPARSRKAEVAELLARAEAADRADVPDDVGAKKIGHVMGLDPRRQAARRFTVCHQDGCMMP
jgi:hypothetical protein